MNKEIWDSRSRGIKSGHHNSFTVSALVSFSSVLAPFSGSFFLKDGMTPTSNSWLISSSLRKHNGKFSTQVLKLGVWESFLTPAPPHLSRQVLLHLLNPRCLVTQSCLTLCDPMDCSLSGFFLRGISQARILEWVANSFSMGSSQPRNQTGISCTGRGILYH